MSLPSSSPASEAVDDTEAGEPWDEGEAEDVEGPLVTFRLPRRRGSRRLDFSTTQPDDRCPCGSGRKYKNCHGRASRVKELP